MPIRNVLVSTVALAAVLAVRAPAQQVHWVEDFESGLGQWTATGLWNLETSADACGASFGPFPSGSQVAWYGVEGACDFDTGGIHAGGLTLNTPIQLPSDAVSISLRYWSSSASEYCWGFWDVHSVRILATNGPDAGFVAPYCDTWGPSWMNLAWHERRVDLSAYRGAQVRIAFEFSAGDAALNDGRGWLIDDVRILIEPGERICPTSALDSGCPCALNDVPVAGGCRNSTGQSATIHSEGAPSLAADTLRFRAVLMTPTTSAILTQGDLALSPPPVFGDGLRCVGGHRIRMGAVTASGGAAEWPTSGSPPISVRGEIAAAGSTRFYYAFYRDLGSYCTSHQFNMTDAQRIVWLP